MKSVDSESVPVPIEVLTWIRARQEREAVEAAFERAKDELSKAEEALGPARQLEADAWEAVVRLGPSARVVMEARRA